MSDAAEDFTKPIPEGINYILIGRSSSNEQARRISGLRSIGWELYGPPFVHNHRFMQALILPELTR